MTDPAPEVDVGRDEAVAARRLEQILNELGSTEVRSFFAEQEAGGAAFSAMVAQAELLSKFGARTDPSPAPGTPRSGAPAPRVDHRLMPRSKAEFKQLMRTDRAAALHLANTQPDFVSNLR